MRQGYLSQYFDGIAAKRLTVVEVDPERSNQHEFQGVQNLRMILGTTDEKLRLDAKFIWFEDNEEKMDAVSSFVTWSDVRREQPERSAEYHLYYSSAAAGVVRHASPGDLLIIGKRKNGTLLIIVAAAETTVEQQLIWLFGLKEVAEGQLAVRDLEKDDSELNFAAKQIIEEIGIEIEETADNLLEIMLEKYGGSFPTTRVFSAFARETFGEVDVPANPDMALLSWMDHEEKLFRTLEKHIVSKRLVIGFGPDNADVDEFMNFSLSVHNTRKSRVGHALENHLEYIFQTLNVEYSRSKQTEGKKKPDFVFPGIEKYHDDAFPVNSLTMLGVKSTCKDRWRQVLTEAKKIEDKHLLTLQPSITEDQTAEMQSSRLQLVLPEGIHETYTGNQQKWLMNLQEFINLVRDRQ